MFKKYLYVLTLCLTCAHTTYATTSSTESAKARSVKKWAKLVIGVSSGIVSIQSFVGATGFVGFGLFSKQHAKIRTLLLMGGIVGYAWSAACGALSYYCLSD